MRPCGSDCYFFFAAFALPVPQLFPFALFLDMHAIVLPSFHKSNGVAVNRQPPPRAFAAALVLFGTGVFAAGLAVPGALATSPQNVFMSRGQERTQYNRSDPRCQLPSSPVSLQGPIVASLDHAYRRPMKVPPQRKAGFVAAPTVGPAALFSS